MQTSRIVRTMRIARSAWLFRLVALGCMVITLNGCNTDDFIHKVNELLSAPGFNLQRLRSIQTNQQALNNLERVDMAIGLDTERVRGLVLDMAKSKSVSDDLAAQGLTLIHPPRIVAAPGALEVQLDVRKTITHDKLTVDAEVTATGIAIISGYQNAALVALRFDTVVLDRVKVSGSWPDRWFAKLDSLVPITNTAIRAILPVLNDVVERHFNEKPASRIALVFPRIASTNLADLSQAGGFALSDKTIAFDFSIKAVSVLVDTSGIFLMAQVDNTLAGTQAPVPQVANGYPPFDENQATPSDNEVAETFAAWRLAYQQRFDLALGVDAVAPDKAPYAVVAKPFLAKTLSGLLNTGPQVCGASSIAADPPPFSTDLNFPDLGAAKCPGLLQSCRYKDACENPGQCQHTVEETYDSFCPGTIQKNICTKVTSWIPFIGNVLKDVCNVASVPTQLPCKLTRQVVRVVDSPLCQGFVATKAVSPLLCDVASNTSKAACDVIDAPGDLVCEAEKTLRNVLLNNPYAHIDGGLKFAGNAKACLRDGQIPTSLQTASVRVDGAASGHVDLTLSYQNKIAPGIGLCSLDWKETFGVDASLTINNEVVDFSITPQAVGADGKLKLDFKANAREIKVDLSKSPLDTVFLQHPQLIANCAVAVDAVAGFIAYDTIFNEKLKKISPYVSGQGIPLKLQPFGFSVVIAPVSITLPDSSLTLKPQWGNKALAFKHMP